MTNPTKRTERKPILKKLSVDHPYYCSESNFYSNEANEEYETMTDFLEEYKDSEVDLNLIFRWDILQTTSNKNIGTGKYWAMVFMIKQRKGIFSPIIIKSINEKEAVLFEEVAKKHWDRLKDIWRPLSI
jgi:uncharacterized protein YydD (DUF2326 family)